jgi:hypothetical protein
MVGPLVALLLLVADAAAYAESPTTIRRFATSEHQGSLTLLQPTDCSFVSLDKQSTRIEVAARLTSLTAISPGICFIFTVRSNTALAWWFVHPPTNDVETRVCSDTTLETLQIVGHVTLYRGFNRITVRLDYNTAPNLPLLSEDVAFVEVGGVRSSEKQLQEVFATVRASESDERTQRTIEYTENAHRYRQLALHPELQLLAQENISSGSSNKSCASGLGSDALVQLEPLLDPALYAALKNNTAAALLRLLGLGAAHSPNGYIEYGKTGGLSAPIPLVASFPVLRLDVAEKLIQELQHAQSLNEGTLPLTIPNNDAPGRKRSRYSGVVLEEIGLGALAEALTVAVLAPIARLMFPAFAGSIDSYHAFSIHVATLHEQPDEQTEGTREQHAFQEQESAPRAEPVEHRTVGDSLPQHIDVCEISMNICLGRNFKGSAVKFTQLNGAKAAIPAASVFGSPVVDSSRGEEERAQLVHHHPGSGFVNICQHYHGTDRLTQGERHSIVVRGLSSQFRRAPAEKFTERCVATPSVGARGTQ